MPRVQRMISSTIIKLPRKIICIAGKDAISVLQGLTTNNVATFAQEKEKSSIYSCFLNTQGRILSDVIIHKPFISEDGKWQIIDNEFWIDVAATKSETLITHIKKYLIRKKVQIDDLGDQLTVNAIISDQVFQDAKEGENIPLSFDEEPEDDGLYKSLCITDPRTKALGFRTISGVQIKPFEDMKIGTIEQYRACRLTQGILEDEEIENKIPFLVNADLLNAINFTKGCYVGQELTSRSYHTGVIRKRCLPFMIGDWNEWNNRYDEMFLDKNVKNGEDQLLGKVVAQQNNILVASVNYLDYKLKDLNIEGKPIRLIETSPLIERLEQYKHYIQNRVI